MLLAMSMGAPIYLQTCSAALTQKVIRFQLIDRFTCFLATMWIAVRSRVTF